MMRGSISLFFLFASLSSCQLLWEANPLEGLDNPILPASGVIETWGISEIDGKMASSRWTAAVMADTTLSSELVLKLIDLQASTTTRVQASLLLVDAYSKVAGVPEAINRVVTHLFPELVTSGLLNGFVVGDSAELQAIMLTLMPSGTTEARTKILQAFFLINEVCSDYLGPTGPNGMDWFNSASLEELGPIAQTSVGAAFIFATVDNSTSGPTSVLAFLDSDGSVGALTTNFDEANLILAFQAIFEGFDKSTTTADTDYLHLDRIGDVLPF